MKHRCSGEIQEVEQVEYPEPEPIELPDAETIDRTIHELFRRVLTQEHVDRVVAKLIG